MVGSLPRFRHPWGHGGYLVYFDNWENNPNYFRCQPLVPDGLAAPRSLRVPQLVVMATIALGH